MRRPGDSSPRKDDRSGQNARKFIDRNPTKHEGLQKNADRSIYGDHGVPGADGIPSGINDWQVAHSEQILVYHEQADGQGAQGGDWMSQLKQNSMQFLADQQGINLQDMYKDSVYKTGIAILIDKIYGLLQRYTFEFNQVVGGTDLHVAGTRDSNLFSLPVLDSSLRSDRARS
jgi:hypothetical protein